MSDTRSQCVFPAYRCSTFKHAVHNQQPWLQDLGPTCMAYGIQGLAQHHSHTRSKQTFIFASAASFSTNVAVLWCSCMADTRSKCELLRSRGSMCKHAVHKHQSLSRIDQSTAPMFTKHGYCTRMQFLPPETLACMTPRACLATRTIARVGQATATFLTYHVSGT